MKIDSTKFGSVVVNGKKYHDILIIGQKIIPRNYNLLKEKYGSGHKIASWELNLLLKENPEIIIIANGQNGVLQVDQIIEKKIKNKNIKLLILKTPEAIKKYNQLIKNNKVNILIHTTC